MRINTDVRVRDIGPAVNWIGGLVGAALDRRVVAFEQQEHANLLLAAHFRENFALEFALAKARRYRKSTGRLPKGDEYDPLYGFLVASQRIHAALPLDAKVPFEGRSHDAVNGHRPRGLSVWLWSGPIGRNARMGNRLPNGLPKRFVLTVRTLYGVEPQQVEELLD